MGCCRSKGNNSKIKNTKNFIKFTNLNIQIVNSFYFLIQKKINRVLKKNTLISKDKPIPKYIENYIYKQMEKCVCKIRINDSFGSGFFCNIPFPNDLNFLPVLITNNHVLGEKDIEPNNIIKFSINDDIRKSDSYNVFIGHDRLTFTDSFYDITIIELKENDGLDIYGLEVDYEEYDASLEEFKNLQIYLIHYPRSNNVCKNFGEIYNISEDDLTIKHTCSTEKGSSGGPIINLNNLKVIGVHKGGLVNKSFNLGTFIKGSIEKFNETYKKIYETSKPKVFTFLKYIDYKDILMEERKKKQIIIKNDQCIIFKSIDQIIYVSIPCSSKYSIFADIEMKLYKIYPEYKDLNKFFLSFGLKINRFKSIKENRLKDNDNVLLLNLEE